MGNALAFIINVILDFYVFVILLRVILQKLGGSWHNPLTQFAFKLTEPVVKPVRKVIPGFKGIDFSLVAVAIVVEIIEMIFNFLLSYHMMPGAAGTVVYVIASLLGKTMNIFFFATIIWAILSWFSSAQHHPIADVLGLIAAPPLRLARKVLPLIAGMDLSPILVIIALQVVNLLLVAPLMRLGLRLAF